jgi:hypothetical protein
MVAPQLAAFLILSAFGTKRTSRSAHRMSAFGGKADIILGKADTKKYRL